MASAKRRREPGRVLSEDRARPPKGLGSLPDEDGHATAPDPRTAGSGPEPERPGRAGPGAAAGIPADGQARLLEEGDPSEDSRRFRRCLSQYATGITIVTASASELLAGVTVNSFSSVSLEPPLVLWCISRRSRSYSIFETADTFAVNVLGTNQIGLAQAFAGSSEDKFAGVEWSRGVSGAPLLAGVAAQLECRRAGSHEGGDHLIIVGEVERYALFDSEPLVFAQGRYGAVEDLPHFDPARQDRSGAGTAPRDAQSLPFLTLMFEAYQSISGGFEAHRAEAGLTRPQVRVMTGLSESPNITLQTLANTKYLGERDAEDAVAQLIQRSYVRRDSAGRLDLTVRGRERLGVINDRWAEFGENQLVGIPQGEVQLARRFFAKLLNRHGGSPQK